MARLKHGGENVGLREYLIEYADDVLMPVMGAVCEVFADSVAQLKAGGEYTFHRYALPDDHPARREGELHDYVTLGTDDVLRSAD